MRRPSTFAGWLAGPLVIAGLAMILFGGVSAATTAAPGQQGTDTSLPLTESALTVKGRDAFANLAITVNQTQKLTNQAVSITWTGGVPTGRGTGRFDRHFLQIFQCWGDDDGTNATNPGPPPEQCEQGAAGGTPVGLSGSLFPEPLTIGRVISRDGWDNYAESVKVGHLEPKTGEVWLPFRAVDGSVVDVQRNPDYNPFLPADYWLNSFYNVTTTNEIPGAVTGPDGTGAELFQVLTGKEAGGLGCGKKVQPVADGKKVPQCWIVVVPRSDQATENAGTAMASGGTSVPVSTSPVAPAAWKNRIAIPIEFNPVDSPCQFSDVERRIAGGELALRAVNNWQPALCSIPSLPPFNYAPVAEATARSLVIQGTAGGPGMAMVSRPITGPSVTPSNPVVYTPVSVSGLVIGFNVERKADIGASEAMKAIEGVRVAELNLTPRHVAKLLTQSYTGQTTIVSGSPYDWANKNPANLSKDPDFRRFNPEFELMFIGQQRTFSGLQVPAGNSDAAMQLWEWVFADPEAVAWLGGQPDEWGMTVNPNYRTDAAANPSGIGFGNPLPTSFPKADPYCYQAPNQGPADSIKPPLVCGTDYMPYARSMASAAQATRSASDGAKLDVNPLAESASSVWKSLPPQSIGDRAMLAFTDTPSAAQFGLQIAHLSRAGDNDVQRTFIAPDAAGLAAGVASMTAREVPEVLEPAPSADAPSAYPLTAITYAAVTPLKLDAAARADFATLLDYATGPGQVSGLDLGQLPRGYLSLSDTLRSQAASSVEQVRSLAPAPDPAPDAVTTTASSAVPTIAATPSVTVGSTRSRTSTRSSSGTSSGTTTTIATAVPESTVESSSTTTTIDAADVPASTTPTIITPVTDLARNRFAIPGLGAIALGSALGALEITKRPRREIPTGPEDVADIDEVGR